MIWENQVFKLTAIVEIMTTVGNITAVIMQERAK